MLKETGGARARQLARRSSLANHGVPALSLLCPQSERGLPAPFANPAADSTGNSGRVHSSSASGNDKVEPLGRGGRLAAAREALHAAEAKAVAADAKVVEMQEREVPGLQLSVAPLFWSEDAYSLGHVELAAHETTRLSRPVVAVAFDDGGPDIAI